MGICLLPASLPPFIRVQEEKSCCLLLGELENRVQAWLTFYLLSPLFLGLQEIS